MTNQSIRTLKFGRKLSIVTENDESKTLKSNLNNENSVKRDGIQTSIRVLGKTKG